MAINDADLRAVARRQQLFFFLTLIDLRFLLGLVRIAATLIGRSQRPRFRTAKMFVVVALSLSLSLGGVLRSSFVSASGVGGGGATGVGNEGERGRERESDE